MQDGLIYDKLAIAHAWYFLQEVDWIELQIVASFFLYRAIFVSVLHIELFVDSSDFDLDDVLDVDSLTQLPIVNLIALLVLTEKCFAADGRFCLIFMSLRHATDLRNPRRCSFVSHHFSRNYLLL